MDQTPRRTPEPAPLFDNPEDPQYPEFARAFGILVQLQRGTHGISVETRERVMAVERKLEAIEPAIGELDRLFRKTLELLGERQSAEPAEPLAHTEEYRKLEAENDRMAAIIELLRSRKT